jgi:outer membrane protein OmpA-like peptidoglycan-associated protein
MSGAGSHRRAPAAALVLLLTAAAPALALDQPPDPATVRNPRFAGGSVTFSDGSVAFPDGPVVFPSAPLVEQVARTGQEVRFHLMADVLFDFDRAELRPEAESVLRDLVGRIKASFKRPAVRVEGHTDALGSDDYNRKLSERRAEAVRLWLAQKGGIPARSVVAVGLGEARPVAENTNPDGSDNPAGRQKNRRVEVSVTAGR